MDFAELNTKIPAENGAALHLKKPWTSDLLFEGKKPCRIIVRGTESETVQSVVKAIQKAAIKGDDNQDENGLNFAVSLVIGFENVERGKEPLTATKDDIEWFFNLSDDFVTQVLEFAGERTNFLPKTSKG